MQHSKQMNTKHSGGHQMFGVLSSQYVTVYYNKETSFVWEYENIEKMAGLCIESFVVQEVTILLINQRTAVFLAPPLSPGSVC